MRAQQIKRDINLAWNYMHQVGKAPYDRKIFAVFRKIFIIARASEKAM